MKILSVTEQEKNICYNNKRKTDSISVNYKSSVCIKPWGYEFLIYESTKIGIWWLKLNKNHSTSIHTHFSKDTIIVLIDGCAVIRLLNDEQVILNKMDSIYIPKKKFHGITCFSDSITLMEIEIFDESVHFSDKNDLLRIDDQYQRPKTGYESSVTSITENIEQYGHFFLNSTFRKSINDSIISCEYFNSSNLDIYSRNNYNFILDGTVFINSQYIKEGSILKNTELEKILCSNSTPLLLSIRSDNYIEDSKIIYDKEHLKSVIKCIKQRNIKIILTSGCYDIIHVGHLNNLREAKSLGDILIVCLSSDEQIKKLKGDKRPINNYKDRVNLFKTISYVDYIVLYNEENIKKETTLDEIIKITDPDCWTKGCDYTKEEIYDKHPSLKNIILIDNIEGKSTTTIIKKIMDA